MFSRLKSLFRKPPAADQPIQSPAAPGSAPAPAQPGNPAKGFRLSLRVQGPAGEREERLDLVESLSRVFAQMGRKHLVHQATLADQESGLEFRPGIVALTPRDDLSKQYIIIQDPPAESPVFT